MSSAQRRALIRAATARARGERFFNFLSYISTNTPSELELKLRASSPWTSLRGVEESAWAYAPEVMASIDSASVGTRVSGVARSQWESEWEQSSGSAALGFAGFPAFSMLFYCTVHCSYHAP
ncbi:hypothetical protein Nepgr_013419 [Nepenthes gracilis]|uniref:Uncharacterized protein n=1 Tax=Nepenthes gracilis TaxID=150966 RepID=A0AAD3XNZ3_NEPGR|nr:hypothetical protein Nepgr_013419 [Nepenthes gracilis]